MSPASASLGAVRGGVSDLTRSWILWSGLGAGVVYGFVRNAYLVRKEDYLRRVEAEKYEKKVFDRAMLEHSKEYPPPMNGLEQAMAEVEKREKALRADKERKAIENSAD